VLDAVTELAGLRRAATRIGLAPSSVALAEHKFVEHAGLRLSYLDWGRPTAAASTIVFLHGGRLTAHTWDLVCLALRDEYRCIALDMRGHGDSSWSAEGQYSIADYAGDLRALVSAESVGSLAVVGQSLGGVTAAYYASESPAGLEALAIIDIAPHAPLGRGSSRIREFAETTAKPGTLEEFVAQAVSFNPRRDPDSLRYSLLHNLRQRSDGLLAWKYDPAPYLLTAANDRVDDHARAWQNVERIGVPALLVLGGASELLTRGEAEALVTRLPRGDLLTIAGAGHSVQGDRPRELSGALREFLARSLSR
jgi:pimeloyl-ACP methyl ester carboxylesterase